MERMAQMPCGHPITKADTNFAGLAKAMGSEVLAAQLCESLEPEVKESVTVKAVTFKGTVEVTLVQDSEGRLAFRCTLHFQD